MRRFFCTVAAALAAVAVHAYDTDIRDIDVSVVLHEDGSASITETWDVSALRNITEWYLVKENLGDIRISGFGVTDENGLEYGYDDSWDIGRSIGAKAGRCGMVRKASGCELCWGIGSYGDHRFTVRYRMSNVVKGLNDSDLFHMQLVSDELSSPPAHVKVTISGPVAFDSSNAKVWGFGFEGEAGMADGLITAESDRSFSRSSSVIVLIRFEKGTFSPTSFRDADFQDIQDVAFRGADYLDEDEDDTLFGIIAAAFAFLFPALVALLNSWNKKKKVRKILGCKKDDIDWYRDTPCGGDLVIADRICTDLYLKNGTGNLSSALILQMVQQGYLVISKDGSGNVEIGFDRERTEPALSASARMLFDAMYEASGSDRILQYNEFKGWAQRHRSALYGWSARIAADGAGRMNARGLMSGGGYTSDGQQEARRLYGFKKFLNDYTLIKERSTPEVGLWRDYLSFGALFGIADKIARELKGIDPALYEQVFVQGSGTPFDVYDTMRMSRYIGSWVNSAIRSEEAARARSARQGGFGGHTSFGGGGGFSGGGHGGGGR